MRFLRAKCSAGVEFTHSIESVLSCTIIVRLWAMLYVFNIGLSHTTVVTHSTKELYLASEERTAIDFCRVLVVKIIASPYFTITLVLLLRFISCCGSQLESANATSQFSFPGASTKENSLVLFRYLNTLSTALQYFSFGCSICFSSILAAKHRYRRV